MAFVRLFVMMFVLSTVAYVLVSIYIRSLRREALEERWQAENPGADASQGTGRAARDAFVAEGLRAYDGSLRRKLIWFVYILPMAAAILIAYMINVQ